MIGKVLMYDDRALAMWPYTKKGTRWTASPIVGRHPMLILTCSETDASHLHGRNEYAVLLAGRICYQLMDDDELVLLGVA